MRRHLLIGSMAVALGVSGLALAEGTGADKPTEPHQDTPQQGAQQQPQEEQGAQTASQQEPQRTGVQRLDSVKLSVVDEESATTLQQKLADLGYYKAEVDGKIGPKTRGALTQYFRDQAQLVAQGRLSEVGMMSLGFDDAAIERVRGMEEQGDEEPTRMQGTDEPDGSERP
jgi:peptidoglycan hydrolase-like protein with peptidoglycan-binding domain